MTCHIGEGVILCDGQSGWRVGFRSCPWCCLEGRQTRVLITDIFGGWCGQDIICGECGQKWSTDEGGMHKMTEEKREENKARVASMPDPKCWDCHDTGEAGYGSGVPLTDPDDRERCACEAGKDAR